HPGDQLLVVRTVPRFVEVERLVKVVLLQERQDLDTPAQQQFPVLVAAGRGWKVPVGALVVEQREGQLLKVIRRGDHRGAGGLRRTRGLDEPRVRQEVL